MDRCICIHVHIQYYIHVYTCPVLWTAILPIADTCVRRFFEDWSTIARNPSETQRNIKIEAQT